MVNHLKLSAFFNDSQNEKLTVIMAALVTYFLKVNRLMFRSFILITLMTSAFSIMAETTLTASVDRNKMYESDTLNLIIMGEIDVDFSLGSMMNFGRNQLEAPNTEGFNKDFEILDQKQSYNMQSINGSSTAQVTWSYSLAAKRTGTLTIPSIKYKDAESNKLTISVLKGKAPQDENNPPQVFIEATIDKSTAYVQEQVIYTLRLYSADRLASGELSVPESNDAIIEALGDTKKYFRMAYNRRYEVRERQYLVFPQKSGKLTIDAQSFNGLLIDTQKRQRVRVREFTEPLSLNVKSPPSSFTGETWLPATSLYLGEKWESDPKNLMVGDSITRTLEIKALGLLGSALPPIGNYKLNGLKVYPDIPSIETQQHESGAQSIRQESIALVAISPTEVTLPEIRIPWWDTLNDVERVAVIPAKKFKISVNPDLAKIAQLPPNLPQASIEPTASSVNTTLESDSTSSVSPSTGTPSNQFWYMIIVLILLGWFFSVLLLLKNKTTPQLSNTRPKPLPDLTDLYTHLCEAIKKDSHEMPKHLILWVSKLAESINLGIQIHSLHDIKRLDESIYIQAKSFEAMLYSNDIPNEQNQYNKTLFLQHIKTLAKKNNKTEKTPPLRPMYP
jgi:hypothetical protein